jgi:hypothetical protein
VVPTVVAPPGTPLLLEVVVWLAAVSRQFPACRAPDWPWVVMGQRLPTVTVLVYVGEVVVAVAVVVVSPDQSPTVGVVVVDATDVVGSPAGVGLLAPVGFAPAGAAPPMITCTGPPWWSPSAGHEPEPVPVAAPWPPVPCEPLWSPVDCQAPVSPVGCELLPV